MPSPTPLECATAIVEALDQMRAAEQHAIEAADALLSRCETWPHRFFPATQGAASYLLLELKNEDGSEYDLERIYSDAVDLRALLEIATLEEAVAVDA